MSMVPSNAMAFQKTTKLPGIDSQLIGAGSGFDECGLCDCLFNSGEFSESAQVKLPCTDIQCEPCASMWRIIASPTICRACYGDFTCPRLARDQVDMSSLQLGVDGNGTTPQQLSFSDSQVESSLSSQDRYVAFHNTYADSDDETISDHGSQMRDDEEIIAIHDLSDEDLREALILANNRVGTNFNIQEIRAEIFQVNLHPRTTTRLADILTHFCMNKASESDKDDASDKNPQEPDEDVFSAKTSQGDGETGQQHPFRCLHCPKSFRGPGHLKQHMVVHDVRNRKCTICGRILGNANSRRMHEKKHRETDSEREERLRKAKVAKHQLRTGQRDSKPNGRRRVPKVLG